MLPPLPARPREGHKGLFGRVLIVGGNDGMIGAPVFAGTAALRCGSGLVQVAVPRSILAHCLSITPELIGLGLGKSTAKDRLLDAAQEADVVVVGPGLGRTPEGLARLQRLVRLDTKPMVLDADALNMLAAMPRWPTYFKASAVLTPHPGEMKRLTKLLPPPRSRELGVEDNKPFPRDDAARAAIAKAIADLTRQVVVLKGHRTVVTTGADPYINDTGNSALSKAGTGDVLSGVIASLAGQGMAPRDAAVAGVWVHGRAGEIASDRLGLRSVLARDVIEALPAALAEYASRS